MKAQQVGDPAGFLFKGKEKGREMLKRKSDDELAKSAGTIIRNIAEKLDANLTVELWNGDRLPLGTAVTSDHIIKIASPGVIASLLKGPSLDKLIRHYIHKKIDIEGGNLLDIFEPLVFSHSRKRLKQLNKKELIKELSPFLLVKSETPEAARSFAGDEKGESRAKRDEKKFIQFHYDVSNEFYKLFLDEAMVYSCAYFKDWGNDINQAQYDKLDMICKKLRLKEGDKFLDIGCGWGSLLIHAAKNYGVNALGVTLAREQYDYALEQVRKNGLEDKITIKLQDYRLVEGCFDKISSIGMYEHVGLDQVPEYLSKVRSLLAPDGIFLNHGITRRGKGKRKRWISRPEKRAIQKYIFPGGDLDSIGNTIDNMEKCGFEIQDVEGWRMHYQLTTKIWCERLAARQEEAIALVGEETVRIWLAYLAGVSLCFLRGSMRLYQTVATNKPKGMPATPQTRADLYQ